MTMKLFFLYSLFASIVVPIGLARNSVPYEPGMTTGCNFSEEGEPAPDLIGKSLSDLEKKFLQNNVVVLGNNPSPYYQKGIIIEQNPEPCTMSKSKNQKYKILLSSGKSEVESAFVLNQDKKLVPFRLDKFGPVDFVKDKCVTKRDGFQLYDIGSVVQSPEYLKKSCNNDAAAYKHIDRTNTHIQIEITIANSGKIKRRKISEGIAFKSSFKTNSASPVDLLFPSRWFDHFHAVNPGVAIGRQKPKMGFGKDFDFGMRHREQISKNQTYHQDAFLFLPPNIQAGTHWITFVFMNLLNEDIYIASEPVQLTIE